VQVKELIKILKTYEQDLEVKVITYSDNREIEYDIDHIVKMMDVVYITLDD